MFNKKADTGIGTLIIFIAMILVAAIAAGVLIQTATSLQNKALLSGERTKGQVSTSASVLLVYGEDGSDDNAIEDLFFKMKLIAGSDPIKLNDSLIEFDLSNQSCDLTYYMAGNCTRTGSEASSGYFTANAEGNFSVEYLVKSPDWHDGYIQRGDVIKLCMQTPRDISADEDINIRFIPKVGNPTLVSTAMPEVINQKRVYIFP
jgi:flagellin-like protein